jgi:hypothetical protein
VKAEKALFWGKRKDEKHKNEENLGRKSVK